MKMIAIIAALGALASAASAATVNTVEVDASAITCLFNANCTNAARERLTPFTLPRTTGTGYLSSRVVFGESNAPAANHYGYEYRLDLTGLIANSNRPPCLLENIRCRTERMEIRTNIVVCTTNGAGNGSNMVLCTTNRFPATDMVTCLTNPVGGLSNVVTCSTNPSGVVVCSTNFFGTTNGVFCVTNHFIATNLVVCETNVGPGGNGLVQCTTNRMRYFTNMLVCRTNYTACPGSPPFIDSLSINVGPILSQMDLDNDGTNTDQVYIVTSGGQGSNAPASVVWDNDNLVVTFSPPLGVGDSSVTVGFVARGSARSTTAKLEFTPNSTKNLAAIGPKILRFAHCDFNALTTAIENLGSRDFAGNNNTARERKREALLELVEAAYDAAQDDDKGDLKDAWQHILNKTSGNGSSWVTRDGARALRSALADLRDCLDLSGNNDNGNGNGNGNGHGKKKHNGDNDDDDDEDCDNDHDRRGH